MLRHKISSVNRYEQMPPKHHCFIFRYSIALYRKDAMSMPNVIHNFKTSKYRTVVSFFYIYSRVPPEQRRILLTESVNTSSSLVVVIDVWMGSLAWLGYLSHTQVVESSNLSPSTCERSVSLGFIMCFFSLLLALIKLLL